MELFPNQTSVKAEKTSLPLQMYTHQYQKRNMTKNHGNMTPPKNAHKAPITESNEMAIYELAHKDVF